jgi:predicted TIM-barrel fold metal-dependent hydrolase
VHTHLALSYALPNRVDLFKEHDRTEHYLPLERELDLDVYINKNFTPNDLKRLRRDLTLKSMTGSGMRATHTAPNLGREMSELSITASVLLPIDFPWLSRNAERYLDVAEKREDIVSLGSVHPFASEPRARLERQKAAGARGIKVHPAVQMIAPDHPRAMKIYAICGELGLPVLFHCGPVGIEPKRGRELSQVKHYWRAVADNPETLFVLGHSGALQMDLALDLCQRYENVYLESSSQSLTNVRRIIDEAPEGRVMFGSDWPFYHQAAPLAKVLLATEGKPKARAEVLWDNAARVFGLKRPALRAV